jgi:hypothetical protein
LASFGKKAFAVGLIVDRYNGYNMVPCAIQYCYAHLLSNLGDNEKEFPDNGEVSTFAAVVIPLLSSAIKLRKQSIDDLEFLAQAARMRSEIQTVMDQPTLGVSCGFKKSFKITNTGYTIGRKAEAL